MIKPDYQWALECWREARAKHLAGRPNAASRDGTDRPPEREISGISVGDPRRSARRTLSGAPHPCTCEFRHDGRVKACPWCDAAELRQEIATIIAPGSRIGWKSYDKAERIIELLFDRLSEK